MIAIIMNNNADKFNYHDMYSPTTGHSDPFVRLEIDGTDVGQTTTKEKNLNPTCRPHPSIIIIMINNDMSPCYYDYYFNCYFNLVITLVLSL